MNNSYICMCKCLLLPCITSFNGCLGNINTRKFDKILKYKSKNTHVYTPYTNILIVNIIV